MKRKAGFFNAFLFVTVAFVAIFTGLLAVVGALHHFWGAATRRLYAGRPWTEQLTPPAPRLQVDPNADLAALERETDRRQHLVLPAGSTVEPLGFDIDLKPHGTATGLSGLRTAAPAGFR